MKYDYNSLVELLQRSVVTITFTKMDGTERVMNCTLQPAFLPEQYRNKAPMLTETAPLNISVWDMDVGGWRSFRLDTVINVS